MCPNIPSTALRRFTTDWTGGLTSPAVNSIRTPMRHEYPVFCGANACSGRNVLQLAGLAFLRLLDNETPPELDLQLVLDNYATHKHPKVGAWLSKRPRFHLHSTPTSVSWLNQVERWFGLISQRAIKRGSFDSVAQLVKTIEAFIASTSPFIWVATAESIFGKLERLSAPICGTPHEYVCSNKPWSAPTTRLSIFGVLYGPMIPSLVIPRVRSSLFIISGFQGFVEPQPDGPTFHCTRRQVNLTRAEVCFLPRTSQSLGRAGRRRNSRRR